MNMGLISFKGTDKNINVVAGDVIDLKTSAQDSRPYAMRDHLVLSVAWGVVFQVMSRKAVVAVRQATAE